MIVFSLYITCNTLESSIVPDDSDVLIKINIYVSSLSTECPILENR
jgi:hypothetical protein